MALTTGTRLGAYEILGPLGAGGMGEVYRARDTRLDRTVAVKVLPSHLSGDAAASARFEREARAVAALSHPHIMAIHDVGTENGIAFAVMELLEGQSLRERLDAGSVPMRKAVEYAAQTAHGLAAAHEKGIAHRDLKPENLFVTTGGQVKILDFGLARQGPPPAQDDDSPTRSRDTDPGTVLGTAGYMSPEQVRGVAVDHRSDIFSLGCVLYEMLAGRRAFRRDTAAETMTAILREEPPELLVSSTEAGPAIDRIVRHCLEKAPSERFQSARDLAFDLEATGRFDRLSGRGQARLEELAWRQVDVGAVTLGVEAHEGRGELALEIPSFHVTGRGTLLSAPHPELSATVTLAETPFAPLSPLVPAANPTASFSGTVPVMLHVVPPFVEE
jgi:serine/threonine protein kinase